MKKDKESLIRTEVLLIVLLNHFWIAKGLNLISGCQ